MVSERTGDRGVHAFDSGCDYGANIGVTGQDLEAEELVCSFATGCSRRASSHLGSAILAALVARTMSMDAGEFVSVSHCSPPTMGCEGEASAAAK